MGTNSFLDITIDDLDESDFGDPISLLEALLKRGSAHKQISSDLPKKSDYLTVAQISQQYNVEVEDILSAIKNGNLVADKVVPLFSQKVVEAFLSDLNNGRTTLFDNFMHEITHMRVNYSYKPVLVMAIMENASENGEIALSDLVDFFLDFYEKRQAAGLVIEKADSSFVKFQNNRQHAARTIRYPITVFEHKQFISFDHQTSVLTVAKPIWQRIDAETKAFIEMSCEKILEGYYALLS